MFAGWEKERQEELSRQQEKFSRQQEEFSRQQFSLGLCTYCKVCKKVYRPE